MKKKRYISIKKESRTLKHIKAMTTRTAKRLLETVSSRLLRVIETSRLLDLLSSYDICENDVLDEYERHLRMLEAAFNELDYARDMMRAAIKEHKQQIASIKEQFKA